MTRENKHGIQVLKSTQRRWQVVSDYPRPDWLTPAFTRTSQRTKLHEDDPNCFWCGKRTRLYPESPCDPDTATIDHLYSRRHPERYERGQYGHPVVLACRKCNQLRNHCEITHQPFIPALESRCQIALETSATAVVVSGNQQQPKSKIDPTNFSKT